MSQLYTILILLIPFLVSCSTDATSLRSNPTFNEIFNKSESEDLCNLLNFFEDQICTNQDEDPSDVDDCYKQYFEQIENAANKGEFAINISFSEQLMLYKKFNDQTFGHIWTFNRSWRPNSTDTFKILGYHHEGKFVDFLELTGKDDDLIRWYFDSYKTAGHISPSIVAGIIKNHKKLNLQDGRVKLIVAIHYLTLNDQYLRNETYKK